MAVPVVGPALTVPHVPAGPWSLQWPAPPPSPPLASSGHLVLLAETFKMVSRCFQPGLPSPSRMPEASVAGLLLASLCSPGSLSFPRWTPYSSRTRSLLRLALSRPVLPSGALRPARQAPTCGGPAVF